MTAVGCLHIETSHVSSLTAITKAEGGEEVPISCDEDIAACAHEELVRPVIVVEVEGVTAEKLFSSPATRCLKAVPHNALLPSSWVEVQHDAISIWMYWS